MKKNTIIDENINLVSFAAGIMVFLAFAIFFSGCSSPEAAATVEEIPVVDTFVHPDSNIAAEMEIAAKFDTLKDSVK